MWLKKNFKYLFGSIVLFVLCLLASYLIAPKWVEDMAINLLYPTVTIQDQYRGKFTVEVPRVYELMYIACSLTETFQNDDNLVNEHYPDYLAVVEDHFGPFANHPLVTYLESRLDGAAYGPLQPSLRLFSMNYDMGPDNRLIEDEVLHVNSVLLYLFEDKIFSFPRQRALIEDFAQSTDFYAFYQQHEDFYHGLAARYHQLCYFEDTHQWLEDRFDEEYDSYRTIFSPLAGGFHNTIPGLKEPDSGLKQTWLFVSPPNPGSPDTLSTETFDIVASKACRKVFTEIDHNYVNPLSDEYLGEIEAAIPDYRLWNGQKNGYSSAYSTFNEYMTWSIFSLYARDTYSPAQLDSILRYQEDFMVEHRKFFRFREFNRELLQRYPAGEPTKIEALYEPMLSWMAKQTKAAKKPLE